MLITVVIALLCAFVAYGRWKMTPPQPQKRSISKNRRSFNGQQN
jgi:hypothetical protein